MLLLQNPFLHKPQNKLFLEFCKLHIKNRLY